MKRIAFYAIFERDGKIRNYMTYYLKSLKSICKTIVVIVNNALNSEEIDKLKKCGVKILIRKNKGFDFYAWKDGIEYIGWSEVRSFDEVILCDSSVYGPIYQFKEVFKNMETVKCDIWGLYRNSFPNDINIKSYLQTCFVVIKRKLITDNAFFNFFKNIKIEKNQDETEAQEIFFTRYFEKCGFIIKSYIDNSLCSFVNDPSIYAPIELIKRGFPLVKRKIFCGNYEKFLFSSLGEQARETLRFLKLSNTYNTEMIIDDMLHSEQMSTLMNNMHLTYVLPQSYDTKYKINEGQIAIIIYSYFEDMVEQDYKYIQNVPHGTDVFIVVVSCKMAQKWEILKRNNQCIKEIRIQENRGRNEAASWITCKDVIESHEFVCVVHDKKSITASCGMIGNRWNIHCWDNLLHSKTYIENVLKIFKYNPKIGLLIPPMPFFGPFRTVIPLREWSGNREIAIKLYKELNLSIPFDESPKAPWGAMFWFRARALQPLFRHEWKTSDFPEEPLQVTDGTILHALERMYPMIAQEAGFLTGTIMTNAYAEIYYDNLMFEFRKQLSIEESLLEEIKKLKTSRSFRLGRAVTWLPRQIREKIRRRQKI